MTVLESHTNECRVDRRGFIAFTAGAFAVAGVPLAMYRRATTPTLVRRSIPVMGTIAEVAVAHHDASTAHAAIDAAFDALRWVETTMTRFTTTSDIGRLNTSAVGDPVLVDDATAMVVAEALRWSAATGGRYDPAVGRTVQLWDVLNRTMPPRDADIASLANRTLFHAVEMDRGRAGAVLRRHDPDVALDLGAIAKGYAVDRATQALRDHGVRHAVTVVGGDLYALGSAPDGEPWTIGIRDPHDARATVGSLRVSDGAVATSGTYVRFFTYRGTRYHHLMDPDVAAPRRTRIESCTVRADSCMHADVASTALFGMDAAQATTILARMAPGARIASVLL